MDLFRGRVKYQADFVDESQREKMIDILTTFIEGKEGTAED